jgi:chemosensory pili system protein ChpA (sensor histidine kinase/response regulator)
MTTAELTQQTQAAMVRSEFRKQDAVIADLREKCTGMTVAKDGYKTVKAARIEVKNLRCQVENLRKDLKADVIERGKIIDEEAARLKNLLIPIETALEKEEEAEEARKAAAARAKVEAEEKKLQERIDQIAALGTMPDIKTVKAMDDEFFEHYVRDLKVQAEHARLKAEEAARIQAEKEAAEQAERDRLAALHAEEMKRQAEELAIRERELQAERAKIEAERVVAEAIRLEQLRIEQEVRDKAEAERQAVIAAENAKLAEQRAELARQQEELRLAEEVRQQELARLESIERAKAAEAAYQKELERLQAIENARLEALKPEIELADKFLVDVQSFVEDWMQKRPNRAWFGYADSVLNAALVGIVEHVRNS